MPPNTYVSTDTLDRADELDLNDQAEEGISSIRLPHLVEQGIRSIRQAAFGNPTATTWTPTKPPDPLPVVLTQSPQPLAYSPTVTSADIERRDSRGGTTSPASGFAAPRASGGAPTAMPSASGGAAPSGGGSDPEQQATAYQVAKASGLDDEGARILVAVTETEGGLKGAIGDNGQSRGGYQFHEGGQMPGFRAWLAQQGIQGDPNQLVNDIRLTTRYAATGYLGRAIASGRAAGLSGPDLATYVQQHGQVSDNPERTGQNYARLYGGASPTAAAPSAAAPSSVPAAAAPAPSFAAGAQGTVTLRHKGTGAISTLPASLLPGMTNRNEFDIVPDQMQKMSDPLPTDEGGPSAGDQKHQKMAAVSDGLPFDPRRQDAGPREWRPEWGTPGLGVSEATGRDLQSGLPATGVHERVPGESPSAPGVVDQGSMGFPIDQRYPGDQRGDVVDADGIDRTSDQHVRTVPLAPGGRMTTVEDNPRAMYRQPLNSTMGPDTTTGADQGPTYNDPTDSGTLDQPLPPYTDGEPGVDVRASASGRSDSSAGSLPAESPGPSSPADDPGGELRAAQFAYSAPQTPRQVPVWNAQGQVIGYRQDGEAPSGRIQWPNERTLSPADTGVQHGPEQPAAPPSRWSPDVQAALAGTSANPEPITPPQEQPTGPLQSAVSSAGRSQFLNEPAAQQAVDIYSAIQELPFDAYARARQQLVSDVDARHMAGTDPLAPFRGLGIQLPSAEELNPEGRPASDVAAGLLLQGALPDPTDPLVETALRAAGKTLGLTFRGVRAGAHAAERGAESVGRGIRGALDAAPERVAAPGEMQLGSGVVPRETAGAPGRANLSPVGQDLMATYDTVTPQRVASATDRALQVASDAIAGQIPPRGGLTTPPHQIVQDVHEALVRNLDDTKTVMTGLRPGALAAYVRGEGLTSKVETRDLPLINRITQDQVNVEGGRAQVVDGKKVKVPYTLQDAADFAQRESEQHRAATGGTRFPDPQTGAIDEAAPRVMYGYVGEGQPLIGPNRPALWIAWESHAPRVSSLNHPFGAFSPGQDIHANMAPGNKAMVYDPKAVAGGRAERAAIGPSGHLEPTGDETGMPLVRGWEDQGVPIGGSGRKIADTHLLVGPDGESDLRAAALLTGMPKGVQQAIARGRMTDPEQIAAVLMRGGSPKWAAGWGGVLNPTRTETLLVDPHISNARAIYITGMPAQLHEKVPNTGGKTVLQIASQLRDDAIRASGGEKNVPILFTDITRKAASEANVKAGLASNAGWAAPTINDAQLLAGNPLEQGLSPGRGRIVDQYTQAIDPSTGQPYMNLGSGFSPGVRAAAYNAAQGGVLGAVGADQQAQQQGRESTPGERLAAGAVGAGLAMVAGNPGARSRVLGAVQRLGSGFVPQGATGISQRLQEAEEKAIALTRRVRVADLAVQAAEEGGSQAQYAAAHRAYGAVRAQYDEAVAVLERIREQHRSLGNEMDAAGYGRPLEALGHTGQEAQPREATSPYREIPAGQIPRTVDDTPRTASLGSGFVPADEPRYDPRLAQEPVLPGFEGQAPRTPTALPESVGDAAAQAEMRAGGTALPGMEAQAADRFAQVRARVPGATRAQAAKAIAEMKTSHLPPEAARALQAAEQRSQRMADKGVTRPSAWDWLKAAGYSGIYSPATAVSSAIGGAQELVLAQPKEALRALVEGRPIATRASARAQVGAVVEGLKNLGRVLVGDASGSAAASGGSQGTAGLSERVTGGGARLVARALEKPGEILTEAPDAVFRPLFRSQGMEREASRVAAEMNLPRGQRAAYAEQLIQDAESARGGQLPTLPQTQRVLDAGEKYANDLGFKGKPGAFGQYLSKLSRRDDAIGVASSFLMPFPSMASRMTGAAIKSTPGAALIPGVRRMYPSRFDMVYDQALGAVAASGMAYWAMNGGITGSGPADSEKRAEMVSQGWQPNSVLIAGHYIPNRMFGRFQAFLDTAGELHDGLAYGKDRTAPQIASELVKRGSKIATDQIGLSGLADLHDMLESGFSSQFPGWAARSITRYMPYGGVLRSAAASLDPVQRRAEPWKEGNPLPAIGEQVKVALPGLRQTVPAAQDVLGRPMENPQQGLGAIIPRTTTLRNDPVIRLFQDAGVDIGRAHDQMTVGRTSGVSLKPTEQRRWNELRGQFVTEYADAYTSNQEFMALPPTQKEKYLKVFLGKASDYADKMVQSEMDVSDLTTRATDQAMKKAVGQ